MSDTLVFLDTETTELNQHRRIWEVGMVHRTAEKRTEHVFQIKDVELQNANPVSLKIGGFHERYEGFKSTPNGHVYSEREASLMLFNMTHGATIVGNVPWFDTNAIEHMMWRNGLRSIWNYHFVDVYTLMRGYLMGIASKDDDWSYVGNTIPRDDIKSDDLSELIGVKPPTEEERHTALGDARWDERIYDQVMGVRHG